MTQELISLANDLLVKLLRNLDEAKSINAPAIYIDMIQSQIDDVVSVITDGEAQHD
jgi:hypothetical protein